MKYEIISRQEALRQGRKKFYTGKPCKYGHDSLRFVSTGGCMACNAARAKFFSDSVAARAFTYRLHPDDMAAALAYCQALDIQRGRTPSAAKDFTSVPNPRGAEPLTLPSHIARHRETLLASYSPPAGPAHLPEP